MGALEQAEQSFLMLETGEMATALAQAEEAAGCGTLMSPAIVARWFVLQGALATAKGNESEATSFFATARLADEEVWLEVLGDSMKKSWQNAIPSTQEAVLELTPEPTTLRVDGKPAQLPLSLSEGVHLIQVGESEVLFGRTIYAPAGQVLVIETGLAEAAPSEPSEPVETAKPPTAERAPLPIALFGGVGLGFFAGTPVRVNGEQEPGAKPIAPLVLGLTTTTPLWVRASVDTALLLQGQWLSTVADGSLKASTSSIGARALVGRRVGNYAVGAESGIHLPGRIPMRAVVQRQMGWLQPEVRAGINLATERAPEPALELVLTAWTGGSE